MVCGGFQDFGLDRELRRDRKTVMNKITLEDPVLEWLIARIKSDYSGLE